MLTRLQISNFKRFVSVDVELGKSVVFIGPNNSGKTTALQALALWQIGVRRWNEKRSGKTLPEKRPGVTINRRDLISLPVPDAHLLWRDLRVRNVYRNEGGQQPQNIHIGITVDGVTAGAMWSCGLEFDFANEESFYCRPLRLTEGKQPDRMPVPDEAAAVRVAFLPPMSGLAAVEPTLELGRINVLIGEGQTAQVLRNLCYQIYSASDKATWDNLVSHIRDLFGVTLLPPKHLAERGEIVMSYEEPSGIRLDLSSSGRGLQQTLLLLAYLYSNPNTVLLLDEPDAHLEILRQRQIYKLLTDAADQQGSQIVAASHSEVILNEAADRDIVVAFVGKPHRIDDRGTQVLKALKEFGFDQYYQAEQTGWVLYLEGSTDLAILQAFAALLCHPAVECLNKPFVHYVGANQPQKARDHFRGLLEAKPDLVGIAIFDRLDKNLACGTPLEELMWNRREIENYLCLRDVLIAYARHEALVNDLFSAAEADRRVEAMQESMEEMMAALRVQRKPDPWSPDIKATDEFLDPLFANYFEKLGLTILFRKSDYHELASLLKKDEIDIEIMEKLDAIVAVATRAHPRES